MFKTFIVSKNSIELELLVDGKVEVKPLPHSRFHQETIIKIALAHHTALQRHIMKRNKEVFAEVAVEYFTKHGYDIREKYD